MNKKESFINADFSVMDEQKENRLLEFLKENYPQAIRDGEINLAELKTALGLPIDEKVNGYGLNFIGRNVAKAKYAQKTAKELKINEALSENFDAAQNMVLKGDNLDCLKILKSYYSGKIKCIYIDPPYNTDSDEFVYPDKFDKEEAEVLGLANLSENDLARMEFSFGNKKSHNGWLSFMYPRLLLAKDLLSKDGVIFISIDDNEQANLKLLCDEVFGEENFVTNLVWEKVKIRKNSALYFTSNHDFILCYAKNAKQDSSDVGWERNLLAREKSNYKNSDNDPNGPWTRGSVTANHFYGADYTITKPNGVVLQRPKNASWRYSEEKIKEFINTGRMLWGDGDSYPAVKKYEKDAQSGLVPKTILSFEEVGGNPHGAEAIKELFDDIKVFDNPKPISLIQHFLKLSTDNDSLILDFFAGSGTTGHAVMQLNAKEENSNRKFILCQIDEQIKQDKPAYKFCIENKLPPVISSITIERLKRAGEKIKEQQGMLSNLDIGFKVFDTVDAPCLALESGINLVVNNNENDSLSRIYNMLFSVGIDNPATMPECILENCIYKIGSNYYITNAAELDKEENKHFLPDAIKKNGKVFIDGWTASINTTLQNYRENVKIVL